VYTRNDITIIVFIRLCKYNLVLLRYYFQITGGLLSVSSKRVVCCAWIKMQVYIQATAYPSAVTLTLELGL
jgi:hypothetical protein